MDNPRHLRPQPSPPTFAVPLSQGDPYELAQHCGLSEEMLAALERAQAVPWPEAEEPPRHRRPARAAVAAGEPEPREARA